MITAQEIREQVFEREQRRWSKITSTPSGFARFLQAIFGKNPAKGFFIVEYEGIDPDSGEIGGKVLGVWSLDEKGPRIVSPSDINHGRTIGRMWEYQLVRVFISEDLQDVVLNEMDGPSQGMCIYMEPKSSGGKVELKVTSASPVLGGYTLG